MIARAAFLVIVSGAVAAAQPAPPPDEGAAAALERLAEAMRGAAQALTERATPWAEGLGSLMADPGAFEPPVTLPNGDILIRRRADAPLPDPRESEPSPPADDAPALDPDQPALDL